MTDTDYRHASQIRAATGEGRNRVPTEENGRRCSSLSRSQTTWCVYVCVRESERAREREREREKEKEREIARARARERERERERRDVNT